MTTVKLRPSASVHALAYEPASVQPERPLRRSVREIVGGKLLEPARSLPVASLLEVTVAVRELLSRLRSGAVECIALDDEADRLVVCPERSVECLRQPLGRAAEASLEALARDD